MHVPVSTRDIRGSIPQHVLNGTGYLSKSVVSRVTRCPSRISRRFENGILDRNYLYLELDGTYLVTTRERRRKSRFSSNRLSR